MLLDAPAEDDIRTVNGRPRRSSVRRADRSWRYSRVEDEEPGPEVAPLVGVVAVRGERQTDGHQLVATAEAGVVADEHVVASRASR